MNRIMTNKEVAQMCRAADAEQQWIYNFAKARAAQIARERGCFWCSRLWRRFVQVGDKVYLNSGSPMLTVTWVDLYDRPPIAYVHWFGADGIHENSFPIACLSTENNEEWEAAHAREVPKEA